MGAFAALFITCLVLGLEAMRAYSSPAVWSPLRTDSEWTITVSKAPTTKEFLFRVESSVVFMNRMHSLVIRSRERV